MKIKLILQSSTMLIACLMISYFAHAQEANFNIIPLPKTIKTTNNGTFRLNAETKIIFPQGNELMKNNAVFLSDYLFEITGKRLSISSSSQKNNVIVLSNTLKSKNPEAYQLTVGTKSILINGAGESGVFYGIQTLRKATPIASANILYPSVQINDEPRFGYRGMMLDVARHFEPVEFVKKYIDILALHNINRFHWHLTEDQGWRIEIKKYPKLTEIGSKRAETVIGQNSDKYDGKPHSGYYTQEQIKDIVAYAQARYITVVPEIDLPGHMLAALASYPELGCTGGPYQVQCSWGVFDDVLCAGKESTFTFLENVLTEVIALFPSKYIHIGGDECPKVRWADCPMCQAKIKELGLQDDAKHQKEFYLQSYVTERIESFLNKHGRMIIGWDEILEGKLAPNATVMSWRGMEGGIEAAQLNHDVIMTPNSYMYFDYYQTNDLTNEPIAIGGYVPLEVVYSFEPVPSILTDEQKKHIIGVQANLWTEYIATPQHIEYMILPRMAALCEIQWSPREKKNYTEFLTRLPDMLSLYKMKKYNYATHIYDIQTSAVPNIKDGCMDFSFNTIDNAPIYYTLDGSEPTNKSMKFDKIIKLNSNVTISAKAIRETGNNSRTYKETLNISKSSFKPITLLTQPSERYTYNGAALLNDGLFGTSTRYRTGRWMGFDGTDLIAIIDLQKPTEISKATTHNCVVTGDWIYDAYKLDVSVSNDGINFTKVAGLETNLNDYQSHWKGIVTHTVTFNPIITRYVKIDMKPYSELPSWHGSKGKPFIFIDEIILD